MSATRIFSTLSGLLDVSVSGVTSGQFLQWNGSAWVAATVDLSGYVPTTRTVNGQALSSDITVTAAAGTLTGSTLASGVTASSLTSVGTLTGLAVASGTLTSSTPQTLTQTWNAGAVTFRALTVNVTNTASASASMFADFQIGGASQCKILRDGSISINSTTAVVPSLTIAGSDGRTFSVAPQSGAASFTGSVFSNADAASTTGHFRAFSANGATTYFHLVGESSHVCAQRVGTNAQTWRLYTTFTARGAGTTSCEYVEVKGVASGAHIFQSVRGSAGGTARDIEFRHGAIDTNGTITNGTLVATVTASGFVGALPIRAPSYTVATVPSASTSGAGAEIYVSNESGGAVTAFSDGTNWRRSTDRAIIS